MDCTKSCSGGGANGNRYGITKTAREHNNPPALIKKQMMIEPTHNSRYSNNNNNNKYIKLYTTNNTHTTNKQHTKAKAKPKELLFVWEYVLEIRTFGSELLDEETDWWSSHILNSISYICITFASCKLHVWHETHTSSHTHKWIHKHTYITRTHTHIETQALTHNM